MVALAAFANTALSWRLESNGAACNEPESHGQVFYSTSYNFAQCRDNCRDRNGDSFSFRASPQACRCNAGRTGSRHIEQNWQCYSMDSPTWVPTVEPTQTPTDEPSSHPTLHPSSSPSLNPTADQPSQNPTMYSPYTYNDPVISNGFYCGHGASGAVAGYRLLRTFNGNEEQCKAECGNDVDCMVFTMPIANVDYECRGSPSASGPCCFLIYVDNAPREAPSNSICPNSAGGYARAANSYRLWAKKTQATKQYAWAHENDRDTCPDGFEIITTAEDCAAATQANVDGTILNDRVPQEPTYTAAFSRHWVRDGCYWDSYGSIELNTGGRDFSGEWTSYWSLCVPVSNESPTQAPSKVPTTSPSSAPTTTSPSRSPSQSPSNSPTSSPSTLPTSSPTSSPSESPSAEPTTSPSTTPTSIPTSHPSKSPSVAPTDIPTKSPSVAPTEFPSKSPSVSAPTSNPSKSPSQAPSFGPTAKEFIVKVKGFQGNSEAFEAAENDRRMEYSIFDFLVKKQSRLMAREEQQNQNALLQD